jgi:raffinose/stachyose/melibiose transport system permease protein
MSASVTHGMPRTQLSKKSGPKSRKNFRFSWKEGYIGFAYLIPAGTLFVTFMLTPLIQTFNLSLWDWSGIQGAPATWVGLDNYRQVLSDPESLSALSHSMVFILTFCIIPVSLGITFAALFSRQKIAGMVFFRTVVFLPQVIASVVIGIAWRWVYQDRGTLNQFLGFFGIESTRGWLGDFDWALPAVGVIGSWVMTGLCMVLFLSGVGRIDSDLYDAVKVDGGGAFREFFSVTLPGLRPELTVATTITIIAALRTFDIVFVTTKGGPGKETIVPGTEIYRLAFRENAIGEAATMAVVLAIIVFTLVRTVAWLLRDRDGINT